MDSVHSLCLPDYAVTAVARVARLWARSGGGFRVVAVRRNVCGAYVAAAPFRPRLTTALAISAFVCCGWKTTRKERSPSSGSPPAGGLFDARCGRTSDTERHYCARIRAGTCSVVAALECLDARQAGQGRKQHFAAPRQATCCILSAVLSRRLALPSLHRGVRQHMCLPCSLPFTVPSSQRTWMRGTICLEGVSYDACASRVIFLPGMAVAGRWAGEHGANHRVRFSAVPFFLL